MDLLAAAAKAAADAGIAGASPEDMKGMDPEVMQRQATQIWSMLDDLSKSDPGAYRKFIAQQKEDALYGEKKHLIPTPGFHVSTTCALEDGTIPVWINVVGEARMNPPLMPDGSPVCDKKGKTCVQLPQYLANAGLAIPLIVNSLRFLDPDDVDADASEAGALEEEWAVDVVVHTWVIEQANADNGFKMGVIELALHSVQEELGMTCSRKYKMHNGYKGPTESGRCVPLFVDEHEARRNAIEAGEKPKPPTRRGLSSKQKSRRKAREKKLKERKAFEAKAKQAQDQADRVLSSPASLLHSLSGADGQDGGSAGMAMRGAGLGIGATGPLGSTSTVSPAVAAVTGAVAGNKVEKKKGKKGKKGKAAAAAPKKVLIEEVLETPEYSLVEKADAITLTVSMPGIQSIGFVDLDVAAEKVTLLAKGKYELEVVLPKAVNHEYAKAKFSKKKERLTLTVPFAK